MTPLCVPRKRLKSSRVTGIDGFQTAGPFLHDQELEALGNAFHSSYLYLTLLKCLGQTNAENVASNTQSKCARSKWRAQLHLIGRPQNRRGLDFAYMQCCNG